MNEIDDFLDARRKRIEEYDKPGGVVLVDTVTVADLLWEVQRLRSELSASRQECIEQARLNGMGSSREAKLLSELSESRKECERQKSNYEALKSTFMQAMAERRSKDEK